MWKKYSWLVFIIGVFIVSGCQSASYQSNNTQNPQPFSPQNTQEVSQIPLAPPDNKIDWSAPIAIPSLQLFPTTSKPAEPGDYSAFLEGQTKYYKIGTIREGKYANDEIVMAIAEPDGPADFAQAFRFVQAKNTLIFLKKYSDEIEPKAFINKHISFEKVDELNALFESRLGAPETIALPSEILKNTSSRYDLKLIQKTSVFFSPKNLHVTFSLPDGRKIWVENSGKNTWSESDNSIFQTNGFYLPLADNTVALYELELPFTADDASIPSITWSNGQKNTDKYVGKEGWSCGFRKGTFANIVEDTLQFETMTPPTSTLDFPFSKNDLVEVGKTTTGDAIYSFKNPNTPFVKAFYQKSYSVMFPHVNEGKVVSFEKFTQSYPFFFWIDPFNRLQLFINLQFYLPPVCAGKPVIYLYPQASREISVKVDSSKKQFISIPQADKNGWKVMADPESHIVDEATGKAYPYLFWEDLVTYPKPHQGFLVKAENVDSFLDQKLAFMGLNAGEIGDFKAFWAPKMEKYPYAFVSFLQTDELNPIVPLEISPKPTSLIRIFMHFEGLQQPTKVETQMLKPTKRSGFAVVEWGGKL